MAEIFAVVHVCVCEHVHVYMYMPLLNSVLDFRWECIFMWQVLDFYLIHFRPQGLAVHTTDTVMTFALPPVILL